MSNKKSSRRQFLKSSTVAGLGVWVAVSSDYAFGQSNPADPSASPNEKLNIGCVGVANRGGANLEAVQSENVVALCDVDDRNFDTEIARRSSKATRYNDFREMLEKQKDLDAVVVAATDHVHVPASIMALNLGKHVYCEKPLAHNVWEARAVTEAARRNKRVTQMGTQIHAQPNYRRVVELVRGGAIGPVREVHVFIDKMWSPANDPPREPLPVPAGLHYDLWLGPAPQQPFRSNMIPANWRKWWDFGNGTLGDMGCHYMDLPFWALSLQHPTKVRAEGPPPDKEGTPPWIIVNYEFPARPGEGGGAELPPVKLTWYDGGKLPAAYESWGIGKTKEGKPDWRNAVVFVGEKGNLAADYGRYKLFPEKDFEGFTPPPQTIPKSIGHHAEWIRACKANDPAGALCNFDYGGPLSEAVLLGNVAFRVGKELEWDARALKATNAPEADKFLRREYRKGWEIA